MQVNICQAQIRDYLATYTKCHVAISPEVTYRLGIARSDNWSQVARSNVMSTFPNLACSNALPWGLIIVTIAFVALASRQRLRDNLKTGKHSFHAVRGHLAQRRGTGGWWRVHT